MVTSGCPRVAIIVLNWNGWRDTASCIDSLSTLDYPNAVVIVVDNGSTDDSVDRIRKHPGKFVLLETGANLGFAGGNNVGIRYALDLGVDYVWLLNNDTTVEPQTLSAMVSVGESDHQVGVVGSVLYYMDEPDKIQAWGGGSVNQLFGISRLLVHSPTDEQRLHFISGASMMLRRTAVEDVGMLDDRFFMYWEDTDLSFRLRKAGWKIQVAPSARVWHKSAGSLGRRSPKIFEYYNASAVRFFRKHASFPPLPILIGVGGRLVRRLLAGDLTSASAVLRGALKGWS